MKAEAMFRLRLDGVHVIELVACFQHITHWRDICSLCMGFLCPVIIMNIKLAHDVGMNVLKIVRRENTGKESLRFERLTLGDNGSFILHCTLDKIETSQHFNNNIILC